MVDSFVAATEGSRATDVCDMSESISGGSSCKRPGDGCCSSITNSGPYCPANCAFHCQYFGKSRKFEGVFGAGVFDACE